MIKNEPLRPIGTVFKHEYPPNKTSTNSSASIITYQIIAHVLTMRWIDDTEGELMEEVKAIDIEYKDNNILTKG